ncbi:hypothetical protein QJS10_CPB20g00296 [Acorus calamus]|uniref:DUF7028 domain-containing protein n=1 Tax=Acorus calamus TaxID=4465 RepID=A0AAV9CET8_ACOCL|nr:hypothetical protein QJS10_CPB20g00296 [Acorus calamus]
MDVHPEAAVEHKSARMLHDIISNVKQRIAAMGWKVESRSHGRSPRTRYISPNGNVFYTIHKIMNHLKEQEDMPRVPRSQENIRSPQVKIELITNKQSINNTNDTELMEMLDSEALDARTSPPVQENFNSVDPASARYRHRGYLNLPPKDLQWGSRKSRYARSEMRIKRPYVVMDSGTSRQISNPVFDYYNLFHEKTGRRKDNVAQKVMDHMKDKALPFLINQGWKMREWKGKVMDHIENVYGRLGDMNGIE